MMCVAYGIDCRKGMIAPNDYSFSSFFCFVSIILNKKNSRLQEKTIDITPLTERITTVSVGKPYKICPKQYIHATTMNNLNSIFFMKYSPLKERPFSLLAENAIYREL